MRDMILVERVTDGKYCHDDCPGRDTQHGFYCGIFTDERVQACCNAVAYRCPSCLATPSAVVLTAEMVEAANMMLAHDTIDGISGDNMKSDIDALRAAFPQIEGVGK